MPALVLTRNETSSQLLQQMHDPKLSGFSGMPLPAAALPQSMDSSPSYRAEQAMILDKNSVIAGLRNPLHHHHHHHHHHHNNNHHLHSLQQHQHHHHHHPHQQHPYYGRSLSHPLANVPPPPQPPPLPPPHHFNNSGNGSSSSSSGSSSSAPRVPPLHAPFASEDILLDLPSRGRSSFLSMLSALKAEGYGRNLVEYFRPSVAAHLNSGVVAGGRLDSSNFDVLSYHSDGLQASVLSSSLPTQISTLYHRMITQSRAQDSRIGTELARLSSGVRTDNNSIRIRPLSPILTINNDTTLALSRGGKAPVFPQDSSSSTSSPPPSLSPPPPPAPRSLSSSSKSSSVPQPPQNVDEDDDDDMRGRPLPKEALPLSMSPLRLSDPYTNSSVSPSLSISPSSLSSHSNPHPRRSSSPDFLYDTKPMTTSSLVPAIIDRQNKLHHFHLPQMEQPPSSRCSREAATLSNSSSSSGCSTSNGSVISTPERPLAPLLPSIIHPASWQMTLSSKDVFSLTAAAAAASPAQLLANFPPMFNPDSIPNPLLSNRLKDPAFSNSNNNRNSGGWYLQHHSNRYRRYQHYNPIELGGGSNAKESLIRPSTPEDYNNNNNNNSNSNNATNSRHQQHHHRRSPPPPGKELPTKLYKQTRLRDRQEVTSALDADRERSDRLSAIKKTTSTQTQTQFSSFPHDTLVVPPPPPYFTTHDTILRDAAAASSIATSGAQQHHHSHHQSRYHNYNNGYINGVNHNLPPPPPHPQHHLPPPPPFTKSSSSPPPPSSSPPLSTAATSSQSSLFPSSSSSPSSLTTSSYPNLSNISSRVPVLSTTTTTNNTNNNNFNQSTINTSSTPLTINSSLNAANSLPPSYQLPITTTTTATAIPHQTSSSNLNKKANLPHLKIYAPNTTTSTPPPPPPPPHHHQPPPPQYKDLNLKLSRSRVADVVQDTPLNLSISSEGTIVVSASSTSSSSSSAPPSGVVKSSGGCHSPNHNSNKVITKLKNSWIQRNGNSQDTDPEDDAIEEHFRRSLGQKYAGSSACSSASASPSRPKNTSDACSMTPAAFSTSPPSYDKTVMAAAQAMESEGVHITGSVDDHFARALGDRMWTAIKARSEPVTPEDDPDTVDAHFAKALGASMWKRLQRADTEVAAVDQSSASSSPLDISKHNGHHHQQHHKHQHHHHLHLHQPQRNETLYTHPQSPKRSPPSVSPIRPQLAM